LKKLFSSLDYCHICYSHHEILTYTHADPKEKAVIDHSNGVGDIVDHSSNGELGEYDELGVRCPPHTTEKKLKARIDYHILPFIIILYLLAFLDRVNVGGNPGS
jgi:hypothetical protein